MSAPDTDPQTDGLPTPRRYVALVVLFTALVLVVLDSAIANLALPSIAASFGAHPSDAVWVVSGYQLAVLIALLPCGALGERFGPRPVHLSGVALFTIASVACVFSVSLPMLICARFLQGLGGGAIMALGVMNLRFVVPQRKLGTFIGLNATMVAVSAAAGPGIAGAILAVAPWPWLFALNIPLGVIILSLGFVLTKRPRVARRLNGWALIANTLMFVLFFIGADSITRAPLSGVAMMAGAGVCLFVLLRVERGSATPLMPTDLLAMSSFRYAVIASVACFSAQMLSMIALPFHLQEGLGMSPARAGLYLMAWPAAVGVTAPLAGRMAEHVRTAWLCGIGGGLLAAGLACIVLLPPGPHMEIFIMSTLLAGIGFGIFQTPNNRVLLLSAPKERSGAAGAMQGTARLSGQTTGAVITGILFSVVPQSAANHTALVLAAFFAAAAGLVSLSRLRFDPVG